MSITISLSCTNCDTTEMEEIGDEGMFYSFNAEYIHESMLCNSCSD